MSDQQRLLVAAVLMSLVLVAGWMMGSRRTADAVPEQEVASIAVGDSAAASSELEIVLQDSTALIPDSTMMPDSTVTDGLPSIPARMITVVIPDGEGGVLARATLNTAGAAVASWEMPHWSDLSDGEGRTVNLANAPWFVAEDSSGSTIPFECGCGDSLSVDGTLELVFTATGGRSRRYTFHEGSYAFEVDDDGNRDFTVSQGALAVTESDVDASRYFNAAWFAEKHRSKKSGDLDEELALGRVLWVGTRSRYFTVLMLAGDDEREEGFAFSSDPQASPEVTLAGSSMTVYAGPVDYDRLHSLGSRTDSLVDFGWPVIRWIGQLIYMFITRILSFTGNWGVRIIILSIVLKAALMPLSLHSGKSMRKMQTIQPKLAELQKKYANDPMRQRQELSKLYKENGVNPLGGCLPLLLQMPIFFALYRVLENAVSLRGEGFIFWITDLSRPEILIPFGTKVLGMAGIGLLPLLMGLAMFYQQKSTITDPTQKSMAYLMPVVMAWFFMKFPAGLSLYWFVNNILTVFEQILIKRSARSAAAGLPAR